MPTETENPQVKYQLSFHHQDYQGQYFEEALSQDISLKMVQIPGGTFLMGSPEDELDRENTEGPQHEVSLSEFFMGMYPITQAQWAAVAELPLVEKNLDRNPSRFQGANRPVEQVSWYDAVEFCARLTAKTRRNYRLPTEAEWEYACRAGTTSPFHFGDTITTDLANYQGIDNETFGWSGSYGKGPKGIYREETIEVGQLSFPNAFGLYDMHGNVWEWCLDHWHENYGDKPEELKQNGNTEWLSSNEKESRLLRGGCWLNLPWYCRSASRYDTHPGNRNDDLGFRVVVVRGTARTLP